MLSTGNMEFVLITAIFSLIEFSVGSPIIEGTDVGGISIDKKGRYDVYNPVKYPSLVLLDAWEEVEEANGDITENHMDCGGVLIAWDVVLTAAHCLDDFIKEPHVVVRAGFVHRKLERAGQSEIAKDYVLHSDYFNGWKGREYQRHDIALVWLQSPFYLTRRVHLAKLADSATEVTNKVGYVAGWGNTETGSDSDMLKEGKLRVVSRAICAVSHPLVDIYPTMICATSKKTAPCHGDSGGPLLVDGVVVGIISWGKNIVRNLSTDRQINTCDSLKPTIFTRVSSYRNWITQQLELGPTKKTLGATSTVPTLPNTKSCQKKDKKGKCVIL